MPKIKKLSAFLFSFIMMVLFLGWTGPALALQDGDFTYELIPGQIAAQITGYTGSDQDVIIPGLVPYLDPVIGLIHIPVESIGPTAFQGKALTSVTIPEGVTTIEGYWGTQGAFSYCTELTSVIIPDSVTVIGQRAFMGCTKLNSVVINNVSVIQPETFYECSGLTSLTLGNGVTSIGDPTYGYMGSFWGAFEGCTSLTEVIIPDSITHIGVAAFNGCTGLTTLIIGDGVKTIGGTTHGYYSRTGTYDTWYGAFSNCTNLTTVNLPESLLSIGPCAFYNCTGLTNIAFSNNLSQIGEGAFQGCNQLLSLDLPDSLTTIGDYAFLGCSSLNSIYLTDSGLLTSIIIPNKVTSIGQYAFLSCGGLTVVNIPESVNSIGRGAFDNPLLTLIDVAPNNVYYYDENGILFRQDGEQKGLITYPQCHPGTAYSVPSGVNYIADEAFNACAQLVDVILADSVHSIGKGAFNCCTGLTHITIPEGMVTISFSAFNSCTNMTTIQFNSNITTINDPYNYQYTIPHQTIIIGYDPSTALDYAYKWGNKFKLIGIDCFDPFPANPEVFNIDLALKAAEYSVLVSESFDYKDNGILTKETCESLGLSDSDPVLLKRKLAQNGFVNIESYNYDIDHDSNLAYVIACRTVNYMDSPRTLVVVICRGTKGYEWKGNMDITGLEWNLEATVHTDMDNAALGVMLSLKDYEANHAIQDPLLLLTGHSRGAAVANIVAEALTNHKISWIADQPVYAYTFATPNITTQADPNCLNIFNFAFEDDFVPQVPLKAWGYDKNGLTFRADAKILYDTNDWFFTDINHFTWSTSKPLPRLAVFNNTECPDLILHIEDVWPSIANYYSHDFTAFGLGVYDISLHDFMREYVAPAAGQQNLIDILNLESRSMDPIYAKIVLFFTDGSVIRPYVNDTHQMYTYYTALKDGGFRGTWIFKNYDATLSDLKINGVTIPGFARNIYNYDVVLSADTTQIPDITFTVNDINKAIGELTQAASLPGTAKIFVAAENGFTTRTYTINFTVGKATDATLSDLQIDGITITGFNPNAVTYDLVLPAGTTMIPAVSATVTDTGKANAVVTQASALPGSASVLVTAEDGTTTLTYTINFTVALPNVPVTGVSLDQSSLGLTAGGQPATLTATVVPTNATNQAVTWSSDNESVATVADGLVSPIGLGNANISVTTSVGNFHATCLVTVVAANVPVTGVSLDQSSLNLSAGGPPANLTANVIPTNATNQAVTWSSDNESVATVADGVVTSVGVGSATITVTSTEGGFTATCAVNVTDQTAPVITVLGESIVNIAQGATYTDAGATATDNVDSDLTGSIIATGSVDTNIVGTYILKYNVSDKAGNAAEEVFRTVNVTSDNESPTWDSGAGLLATDLTQTSLALNWDAATDNIGVTDYNIYQGTTLLATVSETTYNVNGLKAGTDYTFKVEAGDSAGNWSTAGPSIEITTLTSTDIKAPTWTKAKLTTTGITETSVILTWSGAKDNVGVTDYNIYVNGSVLTLVPAGTSTTNSYEVTGLSAGTKYAFQVQAGDAAGNWSTNGPSTTATTLDQQAPTWGDAVITAQVAKTSVILTWQAASDNVRVTGYRIYTNGKLLTKVSGSTLTYTANKLKSNTSYTFSIMAGDAAGNWSEPLTVTVITL